MWVHTQTYCFLIKNQLALSYPVDSDKGTAKFDKAKRVLTVTLPVLSPPPVQIPPFVPKPLVSELEPVEESEAQLTNQDEDKRSHDIPDAVNLNGDDGSAECAPSADRANHTSDSIPTMEEWTSTGEWCCPPLSYRQDESSVTFVLNTPNVKQGSFVTNFSQNSVSFAHPLSGCM